MELDEGWPRFYHIIYHQAGRSSGFFGLGVVYEGAPAGCPASLFSLFFLFHYLSIWFCFLFVSSYIHIAAFASKTGSGNEWVGSLHHYWEYMEIYKAGILLFSSPSFLC